MRIYTKTGDRGKTGLFGGKRVSKSDPRLAAYGDTDELNALLGLARNQNRDPSVDETLKRIQNDLFDLGRLLATPDPKRLDVSFLEEAIDRLDRELPPLRNFILPGGSELASTLHLARTVCRRAERDVVALAEREPVAEEALAYINRLSDFLFVLARWVNFKEGVAESPWEKK